jgi:hypothetical protein
MVSFRTEMIRVYQVTDRHDSGNLRYRRCPLMSGPVGGSCEHTGSIGCYCDSV